MQANVKIPFNKSALLDGHDQFLRESMQSGDLSGNGVFTKRCEELLSGSAGKRVLLTSSGTHALEMIALLLDLQAGDEVILPSYTFSSTGNAFALRGARLRFADNDEHGNILPSEVERLFSKKTKAVMAVHYAGASADMDRLLDICRSRSLRLVEDSAQGIAAAYKGRPLGTIGELGCYSFHETKNISAGEGGALILGRQAYLERAEILREKGTNRSRFFQGLVDKYTWVDIGSSYVLSDLNAAYLYPQVQRLDEIQAKRKALHERYRDELKSDFSRKDVRILETPPHNTANYHMFAAIFPDNGQRGKFIAHMRGHGIVCPFHYVSLHTSPFGASFYDGKPETLPGCEKLSQCLVRFPLYYNLSETEQSEVISKTRQWLNAL